MALIGAAIVGTGFMGWVHLEALRRNGVRVVGVLGSSEAKSAAFANEHGLPRAFNSYEELLDDPAVQVVHIGTPNRFHYGLTKQAIAAGRHVMCEKPLAMDSSESGALVALAKQHPELVLGVNYNIRFYPLCIEARERIRAEEEGRILHVNGSYLQDWLLYPTDYNWRVLSAEGGALRAVADIGTHLLDLIHFITGLEIQSLCADLATVHKTRTRPIGEVQTFSKSSTHETETIPVSTDDYGAIMFRTREGARGSVYVSQVNAGRKNCLRLEIATEQESLAWNSESCNELWKGQRQGENCVIQRDPANLTPPAANAASYPGGHNEGYADSFKQCFRSFYAAVRRQTEPTGRGAPDEFAPFATFADGHREVLLCEAILKSHEAGGWVTIGENEQ